MKKVLCALTIVTMLCVPLAAMAGTTVYGNARISLNYVDPDTGGDANQTVMDNVSRLGLKGTYGEDIKAFFHLQTAARVTPDTSGDATFVSSVTPNPDGTLTIASGSSNDGDAFGQRFYLAGLKGSFGRLAYGRVTNSYKMPGYLLNGKLYDTTGVNVAGTIAGGGASYGLSGANNGFHTVVQYDTPSMAGVMVSGTVAVDTSNANDHGFIAAASYTNKDVGVSAGAVYADNGDGSQIPGIDAEGSAIRGYGSYTMKDKFTVGASVESIDISGDGTDDSLLYVFGIGSVKVAPMVDVIAQVGMVDDGPAQGIGGTVGVNLAVTEKTEILAAGSYADLDNGRAPVSATLCFVHNFALSN